MSQRRGACLCCIRTCALAAAAWIFSFSATCAAFDSDSLEKLIADRQVTSVEGLLESLPPSLLSHYVLVFRSRSLQGASYRDPRVILYGNDAKFVITFNGQPSQIGYDTVEVADFDEQRNRFLYREFVFSGAGEQHAPVIFSEPNPAKCLTCHGDPARPIWDTYPTWPGAYGQRYDADLGKDEREGLAVFLANQTAHPRYRVLRNLQVFSDSDTFHPGAKLLYGDRGREPPNAELSQLLGDLTVRALTRQLATLPAFHEYRYVLLASLSNKCGAIDDYLPQSLRAEFMKGFRGFVADTDKSNRAQQRLKKLRMGSSSSGSDGSDGFDDSDLETLTAFRYVAERALGAATGAWTTALEKNTYDFTAPSSMAAAIDGQLRMIVAETDPSIREAATLRDAGMTEKYCRYLRKRSLSSIRGLPPHRQRNRYEDSR